MWFAFKSCDEPPELTIFDTTEKSIQWIDKSCGLLSKTELTIFDTTSFSSLKSSERCGLLSKTELTIFDTTFKKSLSVAVRLWFAFKNRINDI